MQLRFTPEARLDLSKYREYINGELKDATAATESVALIVRSCSLLKTTPFMGMSLQKKTGIVSDFLYIVSGYHVVFYKVENTVISVIRILDGRTDYLNTLLQFSLRETT